MESCRVSGCRDIGGLSCSCDENIRLCAVHFATTHQLLPGTHTAIFIFNKIQSLVKNANIEYSNNLKLIESTLITGSSMIDSIQYLMKEIIDKAQKRNQEIVEKFSNRDLSSFIDESNYNITIQEEALESFEEICRKYLPILNSTEDTASTVVIEEVHEENKVKPENKENSSVGIKIKNSIETDETLNEAKIESITVIKSSAKEIGEITKNMNKSQRYDYFKKIGVSFYWDAETIREIIITDDCKYMIHCMLYTDGKIYLGDI